MADVFSTALSGLNATRLRQLVSSTNIANSLTSGYKAQRANTATGPAGQGAQVTATVRDLSPGAVQVTDQPFDLTIVGEGFFEVRDQAGNSFYTRDGSFQVNGDGQLVDSAGMEVVPGITVPQNATNIQVDYDGTVTADVDGGRVDLGQIQISRFSNPNGLAAQGNNSYAVTGASGIAQTGAPGTGGLGTIRSGVLEGSNVDLAEEIVNQLMETRMFAANAAVIRVADETEREALDLIS